MNLKQKIKAFFHDPIDKTFELHAHENRATNYFQFLYQNETPFDEDVKNSDHIASAADRLNFPKTLNEENIRINFRTQAEITHPLGGGRLPLSEEIGNIQIDLNYTKQLVENSLKELKSKSKSEKELLLNLWRNIPDIFSQSEYENFRIGNFWNLLPADTRMPDHSILDHNWVTSAINGSLPNPAFLRFSIGPVQSFITAAKRTEDYWAGSYILSYLVSKSIEVIIDELGPEHVIYPYIKYQPLIDKILQSKNVFLTNVFKKGSLKIPSLPNIIFAIVPYESAKNIAQRMEQNVRGAFYDITNKIKNKFSQYFPDNDEQIKTLWENQIQDFIETYWVIYKWSDNIEEFQQNYQKITQAQLRQVQGQHQTNLGSYWQEMYQIVDIAFNSRKNLRNFKQIIPAVSTVKCSLCGEREVIHPSNKKNLKEITEFWAQIGKDTELSKYKIDPIGRDKLCAICFTKRMFGEYYFKEHIDEEKISINYPSTATIAALAFKLKILESWQQTLSFVRNYNELLKKLGIEGNFNWKSIEYIRKRVSELSRNQQETIRVFDEFLSYDGQWLYEESFTEKSIKDSGYTYNKEVVNGILESLKNLKEITNDKPSKYYAVVVVDGDDMGKWLTGTHKNWPKIQDVVHSSIANVLDENLLNQNRPISPSIHSFISKCLNFYSLEVVPKIVECDFPAKLVYCGGDDILAFSPLEYALDIAEKLRFAFSGNLDPQGSIKLDQTTGFIVLSENNNSKIIPTLGNKVTMSAGIVIAHKDHNLSDVLKHAREALEKSKEYIDSKNAFTVKILKRSGNIVVYTTNWLLKENNEKIRTIEKIRYILNNVLKDEKNEGLSMSFFQSMFDELEKLGYEIVDLVISLLKRQLKRHTFIKRQQNENDKQYETRKNDYLSNLQKTFEYFVGNNFKDFLLLIRFLSTGGQR